MPKEDFVHLHLHSEYSLLDGAIKSADLLKKAEEFNMPAVAVTDHGNLFGAIDFYQKGFRSRVKPIIGCEVYLAPGSRHDRGRGQRADEERTHHLVLLVKNLKGYRNLCRLVSRAYTEGFYYKPRIDRELLAENNEGLIALSACLKGEVAKKLLAEKEKEAEEAASFYRDVFGDRFYIELMDHGLDPQKTVNPRLARLAEKLGIKPVATNDVHYLLKEHAHAHDALICIGTGKLLSDKSRMKYGSDEFYFKSADEMRRLFDWIPEAVTNTREVAERCNLDLKLGEYHLPEYRVPADTTPQRYLEDMIEHNLKFRLAEREKREGKLPEKEIVGYRERSQRELAVIKKMKFAGYFLIVWDFINFAVKNDIPVGPGRGSAAGSLVAYCLGITDVDPIKYGLLFERFLNPDRISMPDIDIDFCMERRDEVIKYVAEKYGEKNVAQIITFGTMKARAVLRDVGRVMDVPYGEVDKIAKLVPERLNITIREALKEEKRLAELQKKDARVKELLETAMTLEGIARHASTHAAGVVIAPTVLTDYLPLYKTNKGEVVTQYSMTDCETLGLLKMDFLGLRTLTVIDWAEKKIRATKDAEFTIKNIPLDDRKTFKLLSQARSLGVFQLESSGMRDILRKMKPELFTDIIALVALYRPGPLGSGTIDSFIRRKHGTEEIENILPEMNDILRETYGVIVYQEQVMKLANLLGGFSMAEADGLRKAMGKKKLEAMESNRESFVEGAKKKGIDERKADKVFSLMLEFGKYGFNKSHSAAYALISYRTAYLKAHYPHEFMASILTSEMGNTDKVVFYLNECREMGIEAKPPDINLCSADFTVDGGSIVFGLAAVKNVGLNAVKEVVRAREAGEAFKSPADFMKRVDTRTVNRRALESLVKCGAFDSLYLNRAALFNSLDNLMEEAASKRDEASVGQANMFGDIESDEDLMKRLVASSPEWKEHARLQYEKETVGFYITGHPLEPYQHEIKRLATHTASDIQDVSGRQEVKLCGIVSSLRTQKTKKNKLMGYVAVEDLSGFANVIVWPELLEKSVGILEGREPFFIRGKVDEGNNDKKIIADEIMSLAEAKTKCTNEIHVKLNVVGLEEPLLADIRKLALANRGPSLLVLHFTFPDKKVIRINASDRYRVSANKRFLEKMENLLGANSIYCA